MSGAARAAVLEAHCRELKLPTIRREYPALVRQATHDGWDYEEFLVQLLEAEVLARRERGPPGVPLPCAPSTPVARPARPLSGCMSDPYPP